MAPLADGGCHHHKNLRPLCRTKVTATMDDLWLPSPDDTIKIPWTASLTPLFLR